MRCALEALASTPPPLTIGCAGRSATTCGLAVTRTFGLLRFPMVADLLERVLQRAERDAVRRFAVTVGLLRRFQACGCTSACAFAGERSSVEGRRSRCCLLSAMHVSYPAAPPRMHPRRRADTRTGDNAARALRIRRNGALVRESNARWAGVDLRFSRQHRFVSVALHAGGQIDVSDANDFVVRVCAADDGVALVVHITGELDVATSGDLAEHVEMAVGTGAVRHVVVDLTDVSFMDAPRHIGTRALSPCRRGRVG